MSVPVSPKFPTILRDLVDKSKRVPEIPDIDLSNVGGGGYPIKHVTPDEDGYCDVVLEANTYIIVDGHVNQLSILINPLINNNIVYIESEGLLNIIENSNLKQINLQGLVLKENYSIRDKTFKYCITNTREVNLFIGFNNNLNDEIKQVCVYDNDNITECEIDLSVEILDSVIQIPVYGDMAFFLKNEYTTIKLEDGLYKHSFDVLNEIIGQDISIISDKEYVDFGDIIDLDGFILPLFVYKKDDINKTNEYLVEFSANEIYINGVLNWQNDEPILIDNNYRYVLSIMNNLACYIKTSKSQ